MARFCLQLSSAGITRGRGLTLAGEDQGKKRSAKIERVELPERAKNSRVLIIGGTGRVGGSTAVALSRFCPDLRLVIGGRNRDKGGEMVTKLGNNTEFTEVDINDSKSLDAALRGVDLVVHTAGPFQQAEKCTVLEAAIQNKTAYLDVCDDTNYAARAKSYMNRALDASIPVITTGGIYPGVSNVMAAELCRAAQSEGKGKPQRLRFYYYTAGSGGAGPTILSTSFLLLGEDVVAYNKGSLVGDVFWFISFLVPIVLIWEAFDRNLPEVRSIHEVLGVPTVSARFGTDPFFWNWGMLAMTYLFPPETLRDRSKVRQLVELLDPLVRAVDGVAGEKVSMRVDLDCSNGQSRIGIFSHKKLSVSVGNSTAAFVLAMLEGSTQPGVWFPEEPEGIAVEARETLLTRAAQGTINFVMNKYDDYLSLLSPSSIGYNLRRFSCYRAPWMVETDPKEIGFGIYN